MEAIVGAERGLGAIETQVMEKKPRSGRSSRR